MKFREMRRNKQKLNFKDCESILKKATAGVLSVNGDHGYPYSVPLSFIYTDGAVYFHCAKTGHKIDAIKRDDKVSFCVIDQDEIVPEEYTIYYRSVILFGRARILPEGEEYMNAILKLAEKYNPGGSREDHLKEINGALDRMNIVKIETEHMTGKEAIELVGKRSH